MFTITNLRESITEKQYLKEYSSIVIYEKRQEELCEELLTLIESDKVMKFSKFQLSMN
jgi:hypothetical protein